MLSNEPNRNMADYFVQYDIRFHENGIGTELLKGRKVKGNDLALILWKLIPAVFMQMKEKNDSAWNMTANYLKEELSESISSEHFWMEQFSAVMETYVSSDKQIRIYAMIIDKDHIDLVFTSSLGLSGKEYLEGISSLIQKTYSVLLGEDGTSAEWLKYSLKELVQKDSFWDEGSVTDEQVHTMHTAFYNRSQRFS